MTIRKGDENGPILFNGDIGGYGDWFYNHDIFVEFSKKQESNNEPGVMYVALQQNR